MNNNYNAESFLCPKIAESNFDLNSLDNESLEYIKNLNCEELGKLVGNLDNDIIPSQTIILRSTIAFFLLLIFYIYCIFRYIDNPIVSKFINANIFVILALTFINLVGLNLYLVIGILISFSILNNLLNNVLALKTKKIIYNFLFIFFIFFNIFILYYR